MKVSDLKHGHIYFVFKEPFIVDILNQLAIPIRTMERNFFIPLYNWTDDMASYRTELSPLEVYMLTGKIIHEAF